MEFEFSLAGGEGRRGGGLFTRAKVKKTCGRQIRVSIFTETKVVVGKDKTKTINMNHDLTLMLTRIPILAL